MEGAFFLLADDSVDADDNYLLHPSMCFLTSLPPSASVMCSVYAVPWCLLELQVVCVVDSQYLHIGTC